MKVKDIGEFNLIKKVTRKIRNKEVLTQIGDDASVVHIGNKLILLTTDTMVEGDHFRTDWFSPEQIGKKAMEVNVSDIAAMGGVPKYAMVSMCLRGDEDVELINGIYNGMYSVAGRYGFEIIGGNFTHGKQMVIDISMVGETDKIHLTLRSGAKVGDIICVTGNLGKSKAGLELFLSGKKFDKRMAKHYLEPKARLKESRIISKFANSMIDVSDGLSSEVKHICEMSNVGAVVYKEKIPISRNTKKVASFLGKDPYDFALHGGEDFELVFTISEKNVEKLRKTFKNFSVIGFTTKGKDVILVDEYGNESRLGKGYEHFA